MQWHNPNANKWVQEWNAWQRQKFIPRKDEQPPSMSSARVDIKSHRTVHICEATAEWNAGFEWKGHKFDHYAVATTQLQARLQLHWQGRIYVREWNGQGCPMDGLRPTKTTLTCQSTTVSPRNLAWKKSRRSDSIVFIVPHGRGLTSLEKLIFPFDFFFIELYCWVLLGRVFGNKYSPSNIDQESCKIFCSGSKLTILIWIWPERSSVGRRKSCRKRISQAFCWCCIRWWFGQPTLDPTTNCCGRTLASRRSKLSTEWSETISHSTRRKRAWICLKTPRSWNAGLAIFNVDSSSIGPDIKL